MDCTPGNGIILEVHEVKVWSIPLWRYAGRKGNFVSDALPPRAHLEKLKKSVVSWRGRKWSLHGHVILHVMHCCLLSQVVGGTTGGLGRENSVLNLAAFAWWMPIVRKCWASLQEITRTWDQFNPIEWNDIKSYWVNRCSRPRSSTCYLAALTHFFSRQCLLQTGKLKYDWRAQYLTSICLS